MDTQTVDLVKEMHRDRRVRLIENKELIVMDRVAKKFGLGMKLAVTPTFFNHFYPYAEDAVKGVSFEEVMWDILKVLKRQTNGMIKSGMTFGVLSKTYVKAAFGPEEVETFTDGKARDKRTEVAVSLMMDETDNASMVLSIQDFKFI